MKEFATYSLQANLLLILSYLVYRVLLSNESSFKANRAYLILSALTALVVPLIKVPYFFSPVLAQVNLGEIVISKVNTYASPASVSWQSKLPEVFYFTGLIIAIALFIRNIVQITLLIVKGKAIKREGYVIVRSKKTENIFSFIKFIVVPAEKDYQESEIMQHELTHVKQLHSLDVLFFEILSILFWYNPICYLYKDTVKENHEFLADSAVVKEKSDPLEYAKLITSHALDVTPYTLSGNFISRSFLKRRIIMLVKKPSGAFSFIARYSLVVILLGGMTLLTAFFKGNKVETSNVSIVESPKAVGEVYRVADVMPRFNGNLTEYLSKNINYPSTARENHTTGTVYINFIVSETGSVVNAKILKGSDAELNAEALRVISAMPKWIPGENKGKAVSVSFNLPIHFELR